MQIDSNGGALSQKLLEVLITLYLVVEDFAEDVESKALELHLGQTLLLSEGVPLVLYG